MQPRQRQPNANNNKHTGIDRYINFLSFFVIAGAINA